MGHTTSPDTLVARPHEGRLWRKARPEPLGANIVKKRTLPLFGHEMQVTEVDIIEKKERPAEYTLEDGSVIRFAAVPTAVLRLDGQFTGDGNPVYLVLNGTVVTVVSAPEELRKR
jgi:hypothetical protein